MAYVCCLLYLMQSHRKGFIDDKTRDKLEKEDAKIRAAAKELEKREKAAGGYVLIY